MATTQYIGARYVPRHMGEWDSNTQYSSLDVVLYTDGNSYTAKCFPPKGTLPTNDQYWALSAQFNQQLAALDGKVQNAENDIIKLFGRSCASVKDYGAVGDGVTDDSAAFIEAVTNNKAVYVPTGKYKVNVNTFGICKYMFGDGLSSVIDGYISEPKRLESATIENLAFVSTDNKVGTALGIKALFCTFKNLYVRNYNIGFDFGETTYINTIENCTFLYNNTAVKGVNEFNDIRFIGCTFQQNGDALYIEGTSRSLQFSNCDFEQNGNAFKIIGVIYTLNVNGCYIENNTKVFNCPNGQKMFNSVFNVTECYIAQGIASGWLLTTGTFNKADAEPFMFVFKNNQIIGGSSLVKPFKFDGAENYTLAGFVIEENYFQNMPSTVFDLFDIPSSLTYMKQYNFHPFQSDLPAVSSGVKAYYKITGNLRANVNKALFCKIIGTYTPNESQSGTTLQIVKFPNILPTNNFDTFVGVKLSDGTVKAVRALFANNGLIIYKASNETISQVYFNNEYVLG